jgi:hypothetical protein
MLFEIIKKHVGSPKNSQENGWRPSYLRKRILALFVIAFSATIAALEALYQSSEAHDGIAASTESRHYLWTYGPTAILTIIATFWSRVEFQSKQNAPWQSMLEAPQPAEKSVLLDYISDMQPVAMWRAWKNKHLIVFSGISCSLLLQLMIVFSTGLFSLQEVRVHKKQVPIQVHDYFSAQNSSMDSVGSQPWDIVNGVLFNNLTYPLGTTANLTFQEFSAPDLPSDSIISAPIDGLRGDLSCETATVHVNTLQYLQANDSTNGGYQHVITIEDTVLSAPSCRINNATLILDFYAQSAILQGAQCENTTGPDGARVLLSLTEFYTTNITRTKPIPGNEHGTDDWRAVNLAFNRTIFLVCKSTLSLVKLQADGNATESSDVRLQELSTQEATIPGLTPGDIIEFVNTNTSLTTGFRSVEFFYPFPQSVYVGSSLILGMLLGGINTSIETLWQDDMLEKSASAYYRAMAAQIMHIGLAQKKQSTVQGSCDMTENRVMMMELPLRGIEACLAIAVLLAISMIVLVTRRIIATWNPAHISTIAAVTANSEDFRDSLRGLGVASDKSVRAHLQGQRYVSESTPQGTSIKTAKEGYEEPDIDKVAESKYVEWSPFPGSYTRVAIFALVSAMIIVLEVLLHFSQINNGLGDVSAVNEYMHYLWTIVPALAMSGISLLFGGIDFNTRCLAPYACLKQKKGARFSDSMSVSFIDSWGLTNIIQSMRSGNFAVQATTLATGAAFFLTIIVSGLYSTIEVPFSVAVNFTRIGGFPDPRTIAGAKLLMDEGGEVAGILTAEYILQYNSSFPRWTYDEFAFAKIAMINSSRNGSYVDVRVPALRAIPVCHLQTAYDLLPNLTHSGKGSNETYGLDVQIHRPACPGNNSDLIYNATLFSGKQIQSQPFGYSLEAGCNDETGGLSTAVHWTTSYVWGYVENRKIKHIMGMACMQYAETVDVWTRFKLPGMDIDEEHPPVADESSAQLATDLYTPIPEWWVINKYGQYSTFDGFFQLLVSGRYAIASDNFESAKGNQTIINAIKHQHKLINAQQFGNYTRSTANDSIEHALLHGNVTTLNRPRVVQDATSTRILDALLGSMLVLGIIGSVLLNTDHVLPKSPCSIAAVASLLADSKLLDQFVQGAWSADDKSSKQTFAHRRFYLGWWQSEGVGTADTTEVFTIDHTSTGKEV